MIPRFWNQVFEGCITLDTNYHFYILKNQIFLRFSLLSGLLHFEPLLIIVTKSDPPSRDPSPKTRVSCKCKHSPEPFLPYFTPQTGGESPPEPPIYQHFMPTYRKWTLRTLAVQGYCTVICSGHFSHLAVNMRKLQLKLLCFLFFLSNLYLPQYGYTHHTLSP